ncbi:Aste57867_24059 [Aphanomyces stellatus]|uniref:Aste57867_24059 protein n=1 Tax=Aphanomyces stellatus TaxID=120398 RepID=A0A485LPH3_9STRA|nr:hypothetical protein As57867_023986 [Aphanomyces stellatus]VFU00702.1 Aste57867_24059 [Aphanomyces stellatus]
MHVHLLSTVETPMTTSSTEDSLPRASDGRRQSLLETLASVADDDDDNTVASCMNLDIRDDPPCYIAGPCTPLPSFPLSTVGADTPSPSPMDAALRQVWMLPLVFLGFALLRDYVYARLLPLFAVTVLGVVSVEYFWLSDAILDTLDTPATPPPKKSPLCLRLAMHCVGHRASSSSTTLVVVLALVGTAVAAAALGAALFATVDTYVYSVVATHDPSYVAQMHVIAATTGAVAAAAALLCPTPRSATSLVVFCAAFLLQSIDIVAYQEEVLQHAYILDNGELMAQVAVVVTVAVLFQASPSPRRVLVHVAQHLSAVVHVYGGCTTMAGYVGCLDRNEAVAIFQGVVAIAWGANVAAAAAYRVFPHTLDRRLIPSLATASPTLLTLAAGSVGGVGGMFLASAWFDIPGTPFVKVVYSFVATAVAQFASGWWILVRHHAALPLRRLLLTDAVVLLLPLAVCFYPYYRVNNPNEFLLPRSTLLALHLGTQS